MNQIVFNNVQKKYDKKIVFDNMNLNIDLNGEIISLLGPNGAGKTTLLKMIAGILFCNQGEIAYYDNVSSKKIEGEKYIKWANENVAYLSPSERYLSYKNTARDNILYYSFLKGIPKKKVIENMDEFCSMLNCSHLLDQRIEELSTGQKKIVKIISIFCTDLPVLLLDWMSQHWVWMLMRRRIYYNVSRHLSIIRIAVLLFPVMILILFQKLLISIYLYSRER